MPGQYNTVKGKTLLRGTHWVYKHIKTFKNILLYPFYGETPVALRPFVSYGRGAKSEAEVMY